MQKTNRTGTIACWLSGASTLVYFLSSYAVRNFFGFLAEKFSKTLEIFSR